MPDCAGPGISRANIGMRCVGRICDGDQSSRSRIPQGLNWNVRAITTLAEVWTIIRIRLPGIMVS